MPTLAIRPCSVTDGLVDDTTIQWTLENGARTGTRQVGSKRSYTLRYRGPYADYTTISDLFISVGKLLPFTTYDPIDPASISTAFNCYFDSGITAERYNGSPNRLEVSFKVLEV